MGGDQPGSNVLGAARVFLAAASSLFRGERTPSALQSESADRVCRDGLRAGGEASGARRGDPRCHTPPFVLAPARTGRASIRKSPTRSSPSWRPGGCPGSNPGARRRFRRRSPCRRTPRPSAAIPASTCSSCGAPLIQHGFPARAGSPSARRSSLGGNVRKGEHGTTVVFADRFVPDEERARAREQGDEPERDPVPEALHRVQRRPVRGLARRPGRRPPPVPDGLILPEVEALIRASGADFRIGGDKAFYSPSARLHPGAAARGVFRADQLAPDGAPRARP